MLEVFETTQDFKIRIVTELFLHMFYEVSDIPEKILEVRLPKEEFMAFALGGRFREEKINILKEIR